MEIIQLLTKKNGEFPNNPRLPVLLYKGVLNLHENELENEKIITGIFEHYNWSNAWVNGIYAYQHFHSITHEVLAVAKGNCSILLGGERGTIYKLGLGDVLIIPAGVAHKSTGHSDDFICVGAYPEGKEYDIRYGEAGEYPKVYENIQQVPLPANDPVYGNDGPLLNYWK